MRQIKAWRDRRPGGAHCVLRDHRPLRTARLGSPAFPGHPGRSCPPAPPALCVSACSSAPKTNPAVRSKRTSWQRAGCGRLAARPLWVGQIVACLYYVISPVASPFGAWRARRKGIRIMDGRPARHDQPDRHGTFCVSPPPFADDRARSIDEGRLPCKLSRASLRRFASTGTASPCAAAARALDPDAQPASRPQNAPLRHRSARQSAIGDPLAAWPVLSRDGAEACARSWLSASTRPCPAGRASSRALAGLSRPVPAPPSPPLSPLPPTPFLRPPWHPWPSMSLSRFHGARPGSCCPSRPSIRSRTPGSRRSWPRGPMATRPRRSGRTVMPSL